MTFTNSKTPLLTGTARDAVFGSVGARVQENLNLLELLQKKLPDTTISYISQVLSNGGTDMMVRA